MPAIMQAYRINLTQTGPFITAAIPSNLTLTTSTPIPSPGPSQVLIRLHAAALNWRDLLVLTSSPIYSSPTLPGLIPCADGAGIVETSNHPDWAPGDRVILLPNNSWKPGMTQEACDPKQALGAGTKNGTLAQYKVVDADAIARAPKHLSLEQAAALGASYASAWNAVFGVPGGLREGEWVVSQGTGGVSIAILQLAAAAGAKVISTSSTPSKIKLLKELGATATVNYQENPEWSKEVKRITDGRGADHVVDVAGAGTIIESLNSVRQAGLVSVLGFLTQSEKHDLIPDLVWGAKTIRGVHFASVPHVNEMASFVEKHGIVPPVAKVFGWKEAGDAYRLLASGDLWARS